MTHAIRECINMAGYMTSISPDVLNAAEAELAALEADNAAKDAVLNDICIIIGSQQLCEPGIHQPPWTKEQKSLQDDLERVVCMAESAITQKENNENIQR